MRDRRNQASLCLPNLEHLHHEGNRVVLFEPICYRLVEHGGRERTKGLSPLYLGIEDNLHICPPWVADDRAITERPRSPFHPALEPADHFTLGNCRGCPLT